MKTEEPCQLHAEEDSNDTYAAMMTTRSIESYKTSSSNGPKPQDPFLSNERLRIECVWLAAGLKKRLEKLAQEVDKEIEAQEIADKPRQKGKRGWLWPFNWASSAKRSRKETSVTSESDIDLTGLRESIKVKRESGEELLNEALNLVNQSPLFVKADYLTSLWEDLFLKDREVNCLEAVALGLLKETCESFWIPAGLDPIVPSDFGRLHRSAQIGDVETIARLLNLDSFPVTYKPFILEHRDVTDPNNDTLLLQAVRAKHLAVIALLVNEGADLNAKSMNGANAMHLAAQTGDLEIAELLLKRAPALMELRDDASNLPPFCAIDAGDMKMARFLFEYGGPSTNSIDMLHDAIVSGHVDVVRILLQINPDWLETKFRDCVESEKLTPLARAARHGWLTLVKILAGEEFKADIKNDCSHGSAIHYAAMYGHFDVVKYLAEHYPDLVDYASRGRKVPIVKAAYHGHLAVVKYLLKQGAHCHQEGDSRSNAFLAAVRGGHLSVIEFLADKCPSVLVTTDHMGNNALHLAALRGHAEVVRFILTERSGIFDINQPCRSTGFTALHLAYVYGHSLIAMRLLIEHGADVHALVEDHGDAQFTGKTIFELEPALMPRDGVYPDVEEVHAICDYVSSLKKAAELPPPPTPVSKRAPKAVILKQKVFNSA